MWSEILVEVQVACISIFFLIHFIISSVEATIWDIQPTREWQHLCVGTRRLTHSLWISKWTLNWTQCPRIPHSSHLGAKFKFELVLVRVTEPPLTSLFSLSHTTPSTSSTLDLQALLSTSPTRGCLPSRSLLLGPTSYGGMLAPSCFPCKGKEQPVSSCADFHQTLHSKNSFVQHLNPSLPLQPPAPSLQRLVTLNWA